MTDIVKTLRLLGDRASFEPHMHHVAADEVERLRKERDEARAKYRKADYELGQLEAIIALRTGFTGEPPYVGIEGLKLALEEALNERDNAIAAKIRQDQEAVKNEMIDRSIANMRVIGEYPPKIKHKRRKLGHDADGTPLNIIEPHCGQCVIDPRDGDTRCVCGKQPVRTI